MMNQMIMNPHYGQNVRGIVALVKSAIVKNVVAKTATVKWGKMN
jgi:hypothetical protein